MYDKKIIEEVEKQVEKELEGVCDKREFGYIHVFEKRKKELLKEKGIEWKTSRERFDGIMID